MKRVLVNLLRLYISQDVTDQQVNNTTDLSETRPDDVVCEPDELQERVIYEDNMVKSTGVQDITRRYSLREKRGTATASTIHIYIQQL